MYGSLGAPDRPAAESSTKAAAPYICEFLGTCLLVFSTGVCGSIPHAGAAVRGLLLAVLVYVCGPISGAHLNPAVSVACGLAGYTPWRQVSPRP